MALETQSATTTTSKLGKYALERELAGSGVASTWLAKADEDPKSYVVLRLHKHVTKKVEVADAFIKDAKAGKQLSHANIIPMVETGVGDGEVFVVAEHFDSEPLSALVTHAKTDGIPLKVALRIGLEMLEAIAAAHTAQPDAVAHGELNPLHILVGKDGNTRVAGFGWARALAKLGPHGILKQERLAYAAPERVKVMSAAAPGAPTGNIEPKGDVFAAAVILWELLAKQRLFASKMEAAVVQKVLTGPIAALSSMPALSIPATLDVAIQKALERDPAKRVASVDDMLKAIKGLPEADLATHDEVKELVEKLAAKAAAAPATTGPAAPAAKPLGGVARAPIPTTVGVAPAAAAPANGKPVGISAPKPQPAAEKTEEAQGAATSAKVPAAIAPKPGAPKPIVRSKTLLGGVEPPKPAGISTPAAPKPAPKPEAAEAKEAEAKPADKPQDAPATEAKDAAKDAAKDTAKDAKKPGPPAPPAPGKLPPPKAGLPKIPPPPAVAAKPPPPPVRPPAESLPLDEVEMAPESGPSGQTAKPEIKEPPKEAAAKEAAKKDEDDSLSISVAVDMDEPPAKAADKPEAVEAAKEPVKEAAKAEPSGEIAVSKAEAATVVTTTPTSNRSSTEGEQGEAPVSRSNTKATALDRLKAGSTLGRYEILLRVAKGGMASVWAARLQGSRGFQKTVAIKTMLPDVSDDPDFETMFLDEARVAARIRHPNVVEIFDLGEQDDILYIVMEWVEGDTLSTVQKAAKSLGGIPQNIILRVASQICAGLHAAHELRDDNGALVDLVHRDISPGNILISTSGFAKIADFGVAKSRGRLYVTRTEGLVKGKTPYLSPEQLGGLPLDRRSDLFSLGVLLYVMVTGLHPFRGETEFKTVENIALKDPIPPHELVPSVHPDFEKVILKSLEKDRTKRYATAAEMQRALDQVAQQLGSPVTDEDVADFVRKVIGEANAKRAAELRAAIAAADAGVSAERISIPPGVIEAKPEAKAEKADAAKPTGESVEVALSASFDAAAAGSAEAQGEKKAAVGRLETMPSSPVPVVAPAEPAAPLATESAAKADADDLLLAAQASQKKKRTIIGVGVAAAAAIGIAVFAMGGGDKPTDKPTATTEQNPASTAAAAPSPSPTPAATPAPTPEAAQTAAPEPTPSPAATQEPPKAEEPAAQEPPPAQTAKGTSKPPSGTTTKSTVRTAPTGTATNKTTTTNKTKTKKFDPTGI